MGFFSSLYEWLFGSSTNRTTTTSTRIQEVGGKSKKALCIGINDYPGKVNDLKGCVNDCRGWADLLRNTFNFDNVQIIEDSFAKKNNVVSKMKKIIGSASAGDVVVITFSGHGTSVADKSGDEQDGRDEALCLYDNLLIDDTIQKIIRSLPEDVQFTLISDSCHSGTVTRSWVDHKDNNEPSPRYIAPTDQDFAKKLPELEVKKRVFVPQDNMREILVSGCKATEYSYDARFNGKPMGAMSYNAINVLKEQPHITYNEFYAKLRQRLPSNQYPQTPQLEGSDTNKNEYMFE